MIIIMIIHFDLYLYTIFILFLLLFHIFLASIAPITSFTIQL